MRPVLAAGVCGNLGEPYPADTIIEVRSLALPALQIEIEAIATVADEKGLLERLGDAI